MTQTLTNSRAGRPQSAATTDAILAAARELVRVHGFAKVTTAMIASAAGASKQAMYRRWPTKADLVLDAFLAQAREEVDGATTTDSEERVAAFLARTFAALQASGPALRSLMAAAQEDDQFRATFRDRLIAPRRAALRAVLVEGRMLQVHSRTLDTVVAALFGAMWYRLLLDEPLTDEFAKELAALADARLSDTR